MAHFSVFSLDHLFDLNGRAMVGAYIRFFDAGGNTVRPAYSDGTLTTLYDPNNIRTNTFGRLPKIWLQSAGSYKVRITSSAGTLIEEIDNIPIEVTSGGGGGGGGGGTTLPPGFGGWIYGTAAPDGWVRCNGRTIGSALSLASERANDDCEDLYLWLWANDSALAVEGGRGASAAADWAANKKLTLPDGRGRAMFGRDAMGNSAAGRFAGVTFASGTSDALGASGGAALHTLTTAELASHTHTGTTGSAGSHSHTGTTAADGLHAHTGTTASDGQHNHGYQVVSNLSVGGTTGGSVYAPPTTLSTTENAGAHTHSLNINQNGSHTHAFGTSTNGDHSHSFTTGSSGSGDAHNNMPPFLLVTHLLKL